MKVPTICHRRVNPGHPFAREGEHDVAIFEFGRHYNAGQNHIKRTSSEKAERKGVKRTCEVKMVFGVDVCPEATTRFRDGFLKGEGALHIH
jgi:hypothetical protein